MATFIHDHPHATYDGDLDRLPGLIHEFAGEPAKENVSDFISPVCNLFNQHSLLPVDDLSDTELRKFFGSERRHSEIYNGQLLSFFCGDSNHVMLRAKERLADRPYGHIMQAETNLIPDESILTTTAFGCF